MKALQSEPAPTAAVRAWYRQGTLTLRAEGCLRSPGFAVTIERAPAAHDLQRFSIVQYRREQFCADVVKPYTVELSFSLRAYRPEILVVDADGERAVPVIEGESAAAPEQGGTSGAQPGPVSDSIADTARRVGGVEEQSREDAVRPGDRRGAGAAAASGEGIATGYSKRFDYAEALRDALQRLDPDQGSPASSQGRVAVVEVGVEFAGAPGGYHMFVRVRRIPQMASTIV